MDTALTRSQFVRWRAAIFAIFLASGLSVATWASRVPDIAASLGIDRAQIGLLLLGMGISSIVGISTGPLVMARTGARLGMLVMMLSFGAGVCLIGLGADLFGSVPLVVLGMVLFGYGNYADAITKTSSGSYTVDNPFMKRSIMKLRDDPEAASSMAAAKSSKVTMVETGLPGRPKK